jgi:hypothetical protein
MIKLLLLEGSKNSGNQGDQEYLVERGIINFEKINGESLL